MSSWQATLCAPSPPQCDQYHHLSPSVMEQIFVRSQSPLQTELLHTLWTNVNLCLITNAPWYVTDQILHDDLKVPFIKDVIQERSINHHDKLGNHSNTILQPLLEQQQRRRLKKLWPADLTDGWRGLTGHRVDWIPFQTHCHAENLVTPGIEPETSVSAARTSDH
jgi:hypothetical protein